MDRRAYLRSAGALAAGALAGCHALAEDTEARSAVWPGFAGGARNAAAADGPALRVRPMLQSAAHVPAGSVRGAVVRGDAAYVAYDTTLERVDLATGTRTTRFETEQSDTRLAATPALGDGVVYVGTFPLTDDGGTVRALGTESGAERWRRNLDGAVAGHLARADGTVYAAVKASGADEICALDAGTGETAWKCATRGALVAPPAVGSERVFAAVGNTGDSDRLVAVDDAGERVWERRASFTSNPTTAPCVGPEVYLPDLDGEGNGRLRALDPASGETAWTAPLARGVTDSMAYADGTVYATTNDFPIRQGEGPDEPGAGRLVAFDAAGGKRAWTFERAGHSLRAPAVVSGIVHVGFDDALVAVDAETGERLWAYPFPASESPDAPAVWNEGTCVNTTGSGDATAGVYAFAPYPG